MTLKEHYLSKLGQECGEVVEAILYEKQEQLEQEINDFFGAFKLLFDEKIITQDSLKNIPKEEYKNYYGDFRKYGFTRAFLTIQYFTYKAVDFGLQEIRPNGKYTNEQEIVILFNLMNIYFAKELSCIDKEKIDAKIEKIKLWSKKANIQ